MKLETLEAANQIQLAIELYEKEIITWRTLITDKSCLVGYTKGYGDAIMLNNMFSKETFEIFRTSVLAEYGTQLKELKNGLQHL